MSLTLAYNSSNWTGGVTGNASNQLVAIEQTTFPNLTALQALNVANAPVIVVAVPLLTVGQGTMVGATMTIGGFSASVVGECSAVVSGAGVYQNAVLGILPVTAGMTFASASVVLTIPGISTGGSPYVYGAEVRMFLFNGADPFANATWGSRYSGNASGVADITALPSFSATAGQIAVAAWNDTILASNPPYTITNPSTFAESNGSGQSGNSTAYGLVGSTGSYTATATHAGAVFAGAAAIVGFVAPLTGAIVPTVTGDTLSAALSALSSAGLLTTLQQSYSPGVANGLIISQTPAGGSIASFGANVIITQSQGPAPQAGNGYDVWGATGGGITAVNAPKPIGQALSYAQQPQNAVDIANFSVMAALSSGALPLLMSTPAYQVPTAPTMG